MTAGPNAEEQHEKHSRILFKKLKLELWSADYLFFFCALHSSMKIVSFRRIDQHRFVKTSKIQETIIDQHGNVCRR